MKIIRSKFMVPLLAFVFIATVLFTGGSLTHTAHAATSAPIGGRVSFTFDDGLKSALLAAQTMQPYGISGTNYIITDCVGMTGNPITGLTNTCAADPTTSYMSWDDIARLHTTYGWEIGSHTKSHPLTAAADNKTLTDAGLDDEIGGSQKVLASHGYSALDFASPYGDYDNRSIAVIAKYYNSHRTFQDLTFSSDPVTGGFPYYSPRSSYPYSNYILTVMQVQGNVSVADVEAAILQAKANNQWLILVFHEIKADSDTSYDAAQDAYEYRTGDLAQIAAFVKAQGVTAINVEDGLATGTNLMPNSGFNNGIGDGWTTDSPTIVADKQPTVAAGHGSFDGSATGAMNSIAFTGSATSGDTHLFSPRIPVNPATTYTFKNFVNLTSTTGEVAFYLDEYALDGSYVGGKYVAGIVGTDAANDVQVGNVNFAYTPDAGTATVSLQVIVHGAATGYLDNLQLLTPDGTPPVTPPTTPVDPGTPATPTTPVSGDVNGDGVIDALDLSIVLSNWDMTGATLAQGDVNGDKVIDALDLSILLNKWSN